MTLSLSQGVYSVFEQMLGSADEIRKQIRAAQVEEAYQQAVQDVFKNAAPLVLKHTNAVYCFEEKGVRQFVVYADDSSIRSSLDARQGLLEIALFKKGIHFSQFKALASQKSIKKRHPFEKYTACPRKPALSDLTDEELHSVEEFVSSVEDEGVREALKQAVISDLRTKTPENGTFT